MSDKDAPLQTKCFGCEADLPEPTRFPRPLCEDCLTDGPLETVDAAAAAKALAKLGKGDG